MFHDANSFVFINRSVPVLCKQHDKAEGEPIPFLYWPDVTLPTEILPRRKIKVGDQKYSDPCRWLLRSRQCLQKNRIRCVLSLSFSFVENFFSPPSQLFFFFPSRSLFFFYIFSLSLSCSLCRLCLTSKRRTIKYWESSIWVVYRGIKGFSDRCVSDWGFRMYNALEIGIKF